MKITNKIIAASLLLMAVCGTSCKKYLDINTSPLTATKVDPKLLFGYAITAWDVNKNSGDNYIALGFLGQSFSNGGDFSDNWGASNLYNLSTNIVGNTWVVYYNTGGNNLKQAIAIAEAAVPKANNTAAQCKITLAELMYEATVVYGDIPFSQAFQPDAFPYPKYDAQKDVLEGIIKMLDEANAQIDVANTTATLKITDYDIFYKGDMAKWKKLANSIKLKALMLMVDKDPTKAAAIGTLVSAPADLIASTADIWKTTYTTTSNNENPKYRLFLGENPFTYASDLVIGYMGSTAADDPRLPKYFTLPAGQTTYKGVAQNVDADATTALLGNYLLRKDAPSVHLSLAQIEFYQAEAYARGLGVAVDLVQANTLFRKAVKDAMLFYEADATAVDAYIAAKIPVLTPANAVTQIHIQQWLELMDRPLDAFTQWRRSGPEGSEIPVMTVPKGATPGPLIRRFTLSTDETSSNPNIPNPVPKYSDKPWFDL